MSESESIYGNICSLIDIYEKALAKSSTSTWRTSVLPRDEQNGANPRRNLRKLAFEKLLFRGQETTQSPLEVVDSFNPFSAVQVKFSEAVYNYRHIRQFDRANALEEKFEALKTLHSSNVERFPHSIVKLLLLLKQTGNEQSPELGHISERIVESANTVSRLFPSASLVYGDSKYEAPFQRKNYEQFPASIFNLPSLPKDETSCNLFNASPGTQLGPVWNPLSEEIETFQRSLFGALSKPPSTLCGAGLIRSAFTLDIPTLSYADDLNRADLRMSNLAEKKEEALLSDEGYVSPSPTPTKSSSLTEEISHEVYDWEAIAGQDFMKPCRKTWESLGQVSASAELAFISEAGPEAIPHLYVFVVNQLRLIDSSCKASEPRVVNETEIWKHIRLLCLGISSSSVEYRNNSFQIVPGVTVQNLTPDCMTSWIQIFLECGHLYQYLWQVAHSPRNAIITSGAQNRRGFVFQAFQDQILLYLEFYQESLVNNFDKLNFSSAVNFVESLVTPLRICHDVDCQLQRIWAPHQSALSFLVLLVEQLELTIEEEAKVILSSLLQACATPLLNFVKNWAWKGLCHDPHCEFWVRLNPEYLACKDRRLWNRGFVLVDGQPYAKFFKEFQRLTFECGKALTLLRTLNPKHDIVASAHVPDLDFVLTPEQCYQQSVLLDQYEKYWTKKGAVWAEWKVSDLRCRSRAASVGLKALQGREATMKRIEEEKTEKRVIMVAKRREKEQKVFSELAEALAQKREVEHQQKEEEKAEEEKRQRIIEEQELKEKNEKEKIVEKYAKLLRESEKTEERSLWILRRRNLTEQRNEFLRNTQFEDENQNPMDAEPPTVMTSSDIANQNAEDVFDNVCQNVPVSGSDEFSEIMTQSDIANQNFATDSEPHAHDSSKGRPLDSASFLLPRESNKRKGLEIEHGVEYPLVSNSAGSSVRTCDTEEVHAVSPLVLPEKLDLSTEHIQESAESAPNEKVDETLKELLSPVPVLEKCVSNENVSSEELRQDLTVNAAEEKQPVSGRSIDNENTLLKTLYKVAELPMKRAFRSPVQNRKNTESICANKLGILPWSVLLEKSLLNAVKIQNKLVNRALLHSLLKEHKLFEHFNALRAFMLMYEANFGDSLASKLAGHVELYSHSRSLYNIPALTSILSGAIASACTSEFADNLSFEISHVPETISLERKGSRIISFVTLRYLVKWPQNLVLTDTICSQYSYISSFLLEIRYALWALSDVMQYLNHKGSTAKLQESRQYLQLHIARHKMDHFVRTFHMYLAHELLDVQWEEFMKKLESEVQSLDDVYVAHSRFVALAVHRCLLNQEAKPALEILRQGLTLILRFRRLLIESAWVEDEECKHPRIEDIMKCHKEWQECANLFFLVVQKLTEQGYSELKNLVLVMGFNNYYT